MEEYNNQSEQAQPSQPMPPQAGDAGPQDLNFDVPYRETVSRLFIFRFLWAAIVMWVFWLRGAIVGFVMFFQFWHQLILGRRHRGMWNMMVSFYDYMTRWTMYWNFMIDQRPPIVGDIMGK